MMTRAYSGIQEIDRRRLQAIPVASRAPARNATHPRHQLSTLAPHMNRVRRDAVDVVVAVNRDLLFLRYRAAIAVDCLRVIPRRAETGRALRRWDRASRLASSTEA